MNTLLDLRGKAERHLQTGDPLKAMLLFRLVMQQEPRDFHSRLRIADCLLVQGEVELAAKVYTSVALYSMKAGLPLQALVSIKMLVRNQPQMKPLFRDLADMYSKDSPVMGRGARAAPVDLTAEINGEPELDTPDEMAELVQTTGLLAADTSNIDPPPMRVPPIPLFSELSVEAFTAVAEALEIRRIDDAHVLIKEGEPGDCFYVVANGRFRVERTTERGETKVLAQLREGSVIGEMSVMANEPRSATVVAEGGADVLLFSRQALAALEPELPQVGAVLQKYATDRMIRNLLASNPIFEPFDQEQKLSLFKRFEAHKVRSGTVLVRQDEEGRGLYLVLYGEVEVIRNDPAKGEIQLALLDTGACFGEISLTKLCPTTATVRATRDATVLFLPREYFRKIVEAVPTLAQYFLDLSMKRLDDTERRLAEIAANPTSG